MKEFRKRLENLVLESISNNKTYSTNFLTVEEQTHINDKLIYIPYVLDGGYNNPELKRLIVSYNNEFIKNVSCFKITLNDNFVLTHQNILGSLIALGISKESIGDIIPLDNVFFIKTELDNLIINEFRKIGNNIISISKVDGSNYIRTINYQDFTIITKSLRLDLVVSKIINKNREFAKELIENDLVKINHKPFTNKTKQVNVGDIISIRKYGRYIIKNDSLRTKKDNIVLSIGKFV
ncbi:hypothetical protein CI105_05045 [Candidatus Izimaplasma bacterium ZiA1]|uniref:YlmH/Sll1252 family protein n=1 Tax=Candidatus Izimoplasma sp. ZiA1 TaxID=2024899 RepID=UPI000BAA8AD5|nr:hypothetical protein CI105_05045 [Candidatus Izimaplasma bacterium ZiA1]